MEINGDKVLHIVVDGGPCSGKTSGMARTRQSLEAKGIRVLVVPEVPTLLINGGITPWELSRIDFQSIVVLQQISNETLWRSGLEKIVSPDNRPTVVLYDRGILTGAAYLEDLSVDTNLEKFELSILLPSNIGGLENVRSRYDGVLHMVTAADGAEEFYTTLNNTARTETPEVARSLDLKTRHAWLGHPHLRVIPNVYPDGSKKSFDQKLDELLGEILKMLGLPVPIEIEDKFVLHSFDIGMLPVPYEVVDIEQTYLLASIEERARMRTSSGGSRSFYHTTKQPNPKGGGRIEIERMITEGSFKEFLDRRDPSLQTIKKQRYCFLYNYQYFEVDVFRGALDGLVMCEREKTSVNDTTDVPAFLGDYTNVTDNPKYKNRSLAELHSL